MKRPALAAFRPLLAAALFLALAAPALAQETDMAVVAARVANTIRASKRQSAVVLDFVESAATEKSALGLRLAEEFDQALRNDSKGFQLIERHRLQRVANDLSSQASADAMSSLWVGQQAGAEIVVTGRVESVSGEAQLLVRLWDTTNDDTRMRGYVRLRLPPGKAVDEFLARAASAAPEPKADVVVGHPPASARPSRNNLEKDPRNPNFAGMVELQLMVMPDGKAGKVVLRKGLGMGLDENAIEVAREWKFKPAIGPSGKPIPVQVILEITFRPT